MNTAYNNLESLVTSSLQTARKLCPVNISNINNKKSSWYDKDLHKLKLRKEKAYRSFIDTKLNPHEIRYRRLKKLYFFEINQKKNKFYENKFAKCKNNTKLIWNNINSVLEKKQ